MTKIQESKYPDNTDLIFPCDCGSHHFLCFSWWDDEENHGWPVYMELTEEYHANDIWDRIKVAARILRGKPHYHSGVLLNDITLASIRDFINEKLEK